jgi:hypothetical protein
LPASARTEVASTENENVAMRRFIGNSFSLELTDRDRKWIPPIREGSLGVFARL